MTANVVHPAELERMLQARVEAARAKRTTTRSHRGTRSRRRRSVPVAFLAATLIALSAAAAWASHGSTFIDLTANGTQITHNDSIFTQGGTGAGTGQFDPYLTLSPGGSSDTESGYNVCTEPVFGFSNAAIDCPDPEFDEQTGGDRTHELRVSSIPVVEVGGEQYREFHLDSNDSGADPWMAITLIELYLETAPDLTFAEFTATGDLIWELDDDADNTILMNTQGLESGSGVSDITILVPNDLFPEECFYGATDCDTFLYFYTEAGDPDLALGGVHANKNWNTTAGFEEWRIELLPVVQVQKDVDIAFDRTYTWDVTKSADVESIDLFAGETGTINWTVTATADPPVDGNVSITGEIDILNPTGPGFAISDSIDAVVTDVEDVLTLGGADTTADVTCPEPFPFTVAAGDTVTCTYSAEPTSTEDGTNEATVTIETNEEGDTQDYTATAPVVFANATVNEIDECVEVTDDNATPDDPSDDLTLDEELCAGDSPEDYEFSTQVGPFEVADCDSVTVTNTAHTVTNDTDTEDEASDSVTVNCYTLSVAKTVDTSLTRTWAWDLEKSSDVDTIELFAGDTASIEWTVKLVSLGSTDSGWHVEGDITITNPAPIAADDVAVSDAISGFAGTITIDCGGGLATVDIAANDSAVCSYEADLPDGSDRTNTATATLFGVDYDSNAEDIDFSGATLTEVDDCITVTDDNATPGDATDDFTFIPDPVCVDDLDANGEYEFDPFSTDVGPFTVDDCASITIENTANSETADDEVTDEATADVDVNCYELTVEKDATTTYSRDYDWDIAKTRFIADGEDDGDGDPLTLTLDEGQTYTASYEITVTMTGSTDADHAVSGTITISNPAPMIADDVAVADVISHAVDADIAATVDCDVAAGDQTTVDVPAAVLGVAGTAECSYSANLPNADDRLNTATATLFGIGYEGTANVAFDLDNPTTEIDECIDIVDDAGTADTADDLDLGTVCVDDLDANNQWTDEYTLDIGPFAVCGEYTFTNTVTFVTTDDDNDTDETDFATYTVTIDVPCPEGCTLTQGYWKTHNDSFWGGAPTDETWDLIGPLAENEIFFLSGMTYFDVMWQSPQGNVYFNLAHQYIAAKLNMLDGADGSAITTAFNAATTLFQTYTDEQIAQLKGKNGKELRAQFISLAGTLGSYNEGLIGPGHCDEDQTSGDLAGGQLLIADRRGRLSIG